MSLQLNSQKIASTLMLTLTFAGQNISAAEQNTCRDLKGFERPLDQLNATPESKNLESEYTINDISDMPDDFFGNNQNIFPTFGEAVGNLYKAFTPSVEYNRDDSIAMQGAKYVANVAGKKGTKEVLKLAPGGTILASTYTVYSKRKEDLSKGNGTIARKLGTAAKNAIESLPFGIGENIIGAASTLKSEGTETFGESIILSAMPATATKIEGEIHEVLGSFARTAVISYVPFGQDITSATSALAKSAFGTDTLTGGLLKTGMNAAGRGYSFLSSLYPSNETEETLETNDNEEIAPIGNNSHPLEDQKSLEQNDISKSDSIISDEEVVIQDGDLDQLSDDVFFSKYGITKSDLLTTYEEAPIEAADLDQLSDEEFFNKYGFTKDSF